MFTQIFGIDAIIAKRDKDGGKIKQNELLFYYYTLSIEH
jgi:hypothetical protein